MPEEKTEEKIKSPTNPKWKEYGIFGVGLVSAFVIGFMAQPDKKDSTENYTINKSAQESAIKPEPSKEVEKVVATEEKEEVKTPEKVASATTDCPVKGNVSGKNKIYHVPGGSFYARVKEEVCFQTENEAVKAGFRRSQR